MIYKDLLLSHLAQYRQDVLHVPQPGVFKYRGRDVLVEHILPKDQPWLGIPDEARDTVRQYVATHGIRLHQYFHHLNSSQAFALALFVPFFEGGPEASGTLLRALGIEGTLGQWAAEAVPDRAEGTNLDATWSTSTLRKYFCEVKLTEAEFGVATNDLAHQKKLSDIYAPILRAHIRANRLEGPVFFQSYQIFRNLWHAAQSSDAYVVFLYPRQHEVLTHLLNPVLEDITSELRQRVIVAHAEDVLARIVADEACPSHLRVYAERLVQKYLLATP